MTVICTAVLYMILLGAGLSALGDACGEVLKEWRKLRSGRGHK